MNTDTIILVSNDYKPEESKILTGTNSNQKSGS